MRPNAAKINIGLVLAILARFGPKVNSRAERLRLASRLSSMPTRKDKAAREFRRMMKWIVIIAILMVAGALVFAASQTQLTIHIVLATILGVFFSVVLGTGLFALAFFSDKSGHDDVVTDATKQKEPPER